MTDTRIDILTPDTRARLRLATIFHRGRLGIEALTAKHVAAILDIWERELRAERMEQTRAG